MKTLIKKTTLDKLAAVTPGSFLVDKGLDTLENQLPEAASGLVHSTRELSGKARESFKDMLRKTISPKEESDFPIKTDEDLVSVLKELEPQLRGLNTALKQYTPSYRPSNNFFMDDEDMPLGATFTLMPPTVHV